MQTLSIPRRLMAYGLTAALVVSLLPLAAIRLSAQTALTTTTTSSAVTIDTLNVTVASATGVTAGVILYIDKEAMRVVSISGTTASVQRGTDGSAAATHASGAVVYVGTPQLFAHADPAGPCVSTAEVGLPRVNIDNGNVFQCSAGFWRVYRLGGIRAFSSESLGNGATSYTAAGAITIEPGTVFLNGTTLAMTLANPSTDQNGMTMCIIAANASAHTVTYTAGFGGGTTTRDVATFGGAVNDGFCIVASAGVWWVVPTSRNVTLA